MIVKKIDFAFTLFNAKGAICIPHDVPSTRKNGGFCKHNFTKTSARISGYTLEFCRNVG